MGGWHPDVEYDDLRHRLPHQIQQSVGVARLSDDLEARLGQQRRQSRPQKGAVLG
jgi:hypothetical protein